MPPAIPNYDLGILITLNISLTLIGLLVGCIAVWMILRQMTQNAQESREGMRELAQMHREVAFMIRRQYGDIDRDLQEIKEILGGQ